MPRANRLELRPIGRPERRRASAATPADGRVEPNAVAGPVQCKGVDDAFESESNSITRGRPCKAVHVTRAGRHCFADDLVDEGQGGDQALEQLHLRLDRAYEGRPL